MAAANRKMDPQILQESVKDLIVAAKAKITALSEEVAGLSADNEELASVFERVRLEKEATEAKLAETEAQIGALRDHSASLSRLREDKQAELNRKKKELGEVLEVAEKEHRELRECIKKLAEEDKSTKKEKANESADNMATQTAARKNMARLAEAIKKRDQEILQLRSELKVLTDKEKARIADLANEKRKLMLFISHK